MSFFQPLLQRLKVTSLQNKVALSMLAGILFISVAIAFVARWILVSSLTSELERRGKGIAQSIAERGGAFILDNEKLELLTLIFDEVRLRDRRRLVSYIVVEDQHGKVLAHTMTTRVPEGLLQHRVAEDEKDSVALVDVVGEGVYDVAAPITEGLYRIGTVHVGLSKRHIDMLISKLRVAFLGFISGVILVALYLSQRLSHSIAKPIHDLTRTADEISRGNFDTTVFADGGNWDASHCPAYQDTDLPCWHFDLSSPHEALDMDGEFRHCQDCLFYTKREGDEVVQLADSFRNMVWSIRLYRHRLRVSEEKYRSLFNSGPDPVFVLDCSTGRIMDANQRAEDLYGYPRKLLKGMSFAELCAEGDDTGLQCFEEEEGCVHFPKVIHTRSNGEPLVVNMHACPLSYRGKHAIIVSVTDITEIMEKDAQLIQAAKMKSLGEMSAGIAHELNQPLNAIKMGSEYLMMVQENNMDVPAQQRYGVIEEISTQVDRVSEIIQTLRGFGRKADLTGENIDVNEPVRAVLSLLRRQFELDDIVFDLNLGEVAPVFAQGNRLQQVLFNLLTNARDAINEDSTPLSSGRDRRISITTGRNGNNLVFIEVEDTGCGIPEHVKDKVFEPFYTTKEIGQGMGLGLAISYGIVKDYGGEVSIESFSGKGTCFRLEFPASVEGDTERKGGI